MTDKVLKKISRGELVDMLIYQTEQNKRLRDELESAKKELERREINRSRSTGSPRSAGEGSASEAFDALWYNGD